MTTENYSQWRRLIHGREEKADKKYERSMIFGHHGSPIILDRILENQTGTRRGVKTSLNSS